MPEPVELKVAAFTTDLNGFELVFSPLDITSLMNSDILALNEELGPASLCAVLTLPTKFSSALAKFNSMFFAPRGACMTLSNGTSCMTATISASSPADIDMPAKFLSISASLAMAMPSLSTPAILKASTIPPPVITKGTDPAWIALSTGLCIVTMLST